MMDDNMVCYRSHTQIYFFFFIMDQSSSTPKVRSGVRVRADRAKKFRCKTLTCVLENPKDSGNIGAIVRNCDALGVGKVYVVDERGHLPRDWGNNMRHSSLMNTTSVDAIKWTFVKVFDSTKACLDHLCKKNTVNIVTSPHIKGKTNLNVLECAYTQKQLAIWFGNESRGISQEAVDHAQICVQIEQTGFVESMNLACSTAIVLHEAVMQRRAHWKAKNAE